MTFFNKTLTRIILITSLFANISCEEYLEDELLSDTSVDFLYNTKEGLESAVVGLYSLNRNIYNESEWNNASILIPIAKSDLVVPRTGEIAFYSRLGWGIDLNNIGTKRYSKHWRHGYRIIDRANAIIISTEKMTDIDEGFKNKIIAEAKAFRANAYFTLFRQFNNIFITTTPTSPENVFERAENKSSEEEIFELINNDLEFAIQHLDWTTQEFGRWTQASTRHLKAKVAAWQKDWKEAAYQTDAIINQGSYKLVNNTKDVFLGDMNHTETLFAIQMEDAIIGGGNRNNIHFNFIAQYNDIPGADFSTSNGARGFGSLLMNDYLRNLLNEDPNDDRNDGSYYITKYIYNDPANLPEGKKIGDTIALYNQYSSDNNQVKNYYKTMNPGCLKYLQEDAVPNEVSQISNIMVYRLAETFLIGAEAHMMNGNTSKALEYINTVRKRARAKSINSINQKVILEERARELAFEGQRFYTLKRMGLLVDYIRDHASNEGFFDQARTRMQPYMENWAIPTAELELLGPNYPQNEGYPN
ncbi:RagB/SusD family nutrient uptake outer membrane protein [Joostella sp.]|uniref:RagB/SusD family nutrient uptake outer membrane protein n=1 Tax=Joostella sp. TaxID=2231138 RepID=UPI003A92AFB8